MFSFATLNNRSVGWWEEPTCSKKLTLSYIKFARLKTSTEVTESANWPFGRQPMLSDEHDQGKRETYDYIPKSNKRDVETIYTSHAVIAQVINEAAFRYFKPQNKLSYRETLSNRVNVRVSPTLDTLFVYLE